MHLSHTTPPHRPQATRPLAVFFFLRRHTRCDARYGQCTGLRALRHPHMARHSRVPAFFAPHRPFAAQVRAQHARIHTFYLKFLQGHT